MKNLLFGLLIGGMIALGGVLVGQHFVTKQAPTTTQSFGAFTPVEATPFSVAKTVLPTDNTITLSSFNTPDGRTLTMANFGSKGYGTLDPTNLSRIESISFTGIAPQANGTVQLTGVSRGNDFVSPYAASTTLSQLHLVGSSFIVTNTAGFYGNEFLFANNAGTSSAVLVFGSTTPPHYDLDQGASFWTTAASSTLVDLAQLQRTALAGTVNASTIVQGLVQIATAAQAALGTAVGSTGALLALPASMATSTPTFQGTNVIPVTGTNNKLSQLFLDLTQAFTFSTTTTYNANFGRIVATSTIASSFNYASTTMISATTASTTNLVLSGTCTKGNGTGCNQITQITNTGSLNTGTGNTTTVVATCSGSQLVAGGGYSGLGGASGSAVWETTQDGPSASNAWTVTVFCNLNACGGSTLTVYAMCVNP